MEHTHWLAFHWHWFWIVPILCMVLMFIMCRRAAWRCGTGRFGRGRFACWTPANLDMADSWPDTPRQILDRRYASGEITQQQYEQLRRDIESGPSHSGDEPGDFTNQAIPRS